MAEPRHDWYLREWLKALEIRFPHAWLQREVGYSDGKASNVLTGKKRYDRDIINEIAGAMKIQPYELLLHPEDAMAIREMRRAAPRLIASTAISQGVEAEPPKAAEAPRRRRA